MNKHCMTRTSKRYLRALAKYGFTSALEAEEPTARAPAHKNSYKYS